MTEMKIEDLVRVVKGCTDYGGGYIGAEYAAFQAGVGTVIAAVDHAVSDPDSQTRALIAVARAAEPISEVTTIGELRARLGEFSLDLTRVRGAWMARVWSVHSGARGVAMREDLGTAIRDALAESQTERLL